MSSKSRRRRQRKSKQNNNSNTSTTNDDVNYIDKFKIIDQPKTTGKLQISELLLYGYIREITQTMNHNVPTDIEQLCHTYFNDEDIILNELEEIITIITKLKYEKKPRVPCKYSMRRRKRLRKALTAQEIQERKKLDEYNERLQNNKLRITHCMLQFNETFNGLTFYQKRLICKKIIRQKKWRIDDFIVWINNRNNDRNKCVSEEIYFVEYILCKRYNTISKLDLSEMEWTDDHILYLCNMIQDIIKYNTEKKRQKALQLKTINEIEDVSPAKNTKQRPIYCGHSKMQKEVEKQLNKKMSLQKQITMALQEIDLSTNNITDKHLGLLLSIIKKYMPKIKVLNLSQNMITNKALSVIMKYGVTGLQIELTHCKGITLKALNKYQRTHYDDERPSKYVYCKQMVFFDNQWEEQQFVDIGAVGAKRISGKGKKFQAWQRKGGFQDVYDDWPWSG